MNFKKRTVFYVVGLSAVKKEKKKLNSELKN